MVDISKKSGQYSSASGGRITDEMDITEEKRNRIKDEIKNVDDFGKEIGGASEKDISEILEIIMGAAIYLGASDIHMEPEETGIKIRLRIDGLLQDATKINPPIYQRLLSRIKLLSGVKLNVTDRPQDGRFSVLLGEKKSDAIEIRVSVLPSEHGESTVMRVLNPKSLIGLEDLGLRPDLFSLFDKEIKKPNGMIIITGPTGSGKTTTLYAFLNRIQNPEVKIITIEDPIEYHLEGISQTQVNPSKGYDFASGLQAIVRQDPDVILVGEIRDEKTCQIAIQAALTGHLVFTTLHTNDAAGTVSRLISLGADLSNIGPAVNLAVAQRLVRKVCVCKEMKTVSPEELTKLKEGLKNVKHTVELPVLDEKLKIPRTKGCAVCNSTGYKGRVGIFEAILIDDEMEKSIIKNPSIAAFREEAIERGMVTMYQDGLIKVLKGETTIEEVERATGE
jgi:type II secretory ATPase GspE/PulE/Tfp pilus assembly ATPase PilB-like protein